MSAVLVDRTARLRMVFSGEKAKESLGGLVTNDVVALRPGHGQRAVALTPKGRVIALVRVMDRGDDLLLDCEPSAAEGFVAMIRKFVNPRTAKYAVVSDTTAAIGVFGAAAAKHLAPAVGATLDVLDALPVLGLWRSPDGTFDVLRSDEFSAPGFEVIASREHIATLRTALEAQGLHEADATTLETMAVERGLPRFGVDMDAETIPQEANLDAHGAISFTKGCYTGQEVVARIHFRGHVNRHLRWLTSATALPVGATVLDADGKDVGEVRASAVSASRGPLAIAMVRREIGLGATVSVLPNRAEGDAPLGGPAVPATVEAIA